MPKATDEQRKAFGQALREAMRKRPNRKPEDGKDDEWLGKQIGMTGQAIRNYVAGIREPKNLKTVAMMELALEVELFSLAQHLGYPVPGPSEVNRLADLEDRVTQLQGKLDEALGLIESIAQRIPQPGPSGPRASTATRRASPSSS